MTPLATARTCVGLRASSISPGAHFFGQESWTLRERFEADWLPSPGNDG
jgi:hypothetical protein